MDGPIGAAALARRYDANMAAYWRGEELDHGFLRWLAGWWRPGPVGELNSAEPDAISPHGGAGRGIAWFDNDAMILGVVRGRDGGCYVIPRNQAIAGRPPAPPAGTRINAVPALGAGSSPV